MRHSTKLGKMFICAFCIETNEWFLKEYATEAEGRAIFDEASTKYGFNSDVIEAANEAQAQGFLFRIMEKAGYAPGERMEVL